MAKRQSRRILTIGAAILVAAGLTAAFWPQAELVDLGKARRGPIMVTVDEEARTRVQESYVVSTPIAGRLLRVALVPGDVVAKGETVVARMLPTNPAALDARTREQANAGIAAAEAALRVAEADMHRAMADRDLGASDLNRARKLFENGNTSKAALDRAESKWRTVEASIDTARAAISMRVAEVENAKATLIGLDRSGADSNNGDAIKVLAPVSGRVLQVIQQSETILSAGAPVLELGDITNDLEIVVELLSTDAVRVSKGDRVIIENWGRDAPLNGVVERIDPWGFTKHSALGVEEQRVNAVIGFTDPPEARESLGHGFRVETRIVTWENPDALIVPSAALFRDNGDWAVFSVSEGLAALSKVKVGRNNGVVAEITSGLEAGQQVVLYPSAGLLDGAKVAERGTN